MKKTKKKKAEAYYEKCLAVIEKKLGNSITDTKMLNHQGKKMFGKQYIGTFGSDQIPKLKSNDMIIVNNQTSKQEGEHWLAIVKTTDDNILIYDSFGRRHYKILPVLSQYGTYIKESENDAEQHVKEDNCGQRCLAFLKVYKKLGYSYAIWI